MGWGRRKDESRSKCAHLGRGGSSGRFAGNEGHRQVPQGSNGMNYTVEQRH